MADKCGPAVVNPLDRRAPIQVGRLTGQQYAGVACLRCEHLFMFGERPKTVAITGLDCHALRACVECAPLIIAPPPWPLFGSA